MKKVLLARQPIFDARDEIAGYEVLYGGRDGAASASVPAAEAGATENVRVVLDAFLGAGVEQLANGLPAFVSVTRDMLLGRLVELLDPTRVVVQIAADEARDDALVAACGDLYTAGYHFAIDGADPAAPADPLLQWAEYVKVDVRATPAEHFAPFAERLKPLGIRLVAENVEHRGVRDACVAAGIELFQGYHFSRPETITKRDVPVDQLRLFQLMNRVRDVNAPDGRIEEEFRTDVSLSYKLLRIVNSAAVGARGVRSIGHGIRLLGRDALYKWLGLLLCSTGRDRGIDKELTLTSLIRARFCELLADAGPRPLAAGSLYIVGLLSLMDTVLGQEMEELVKPLDLAPEVRSALIGRRGVFGDVLRLVEAYETGAWDDVTVIAGELNITEEQISDLYLESIVWAREKAGGLERVAA